MNTLQKEWKDYEAAAINPKAGDVQRLETQKAYYAGAYTVLMILGEISAGVISEEAAVEVLRGLNLECHDFVAGVTGKTADIAKKIIISKS